MDPQIQQLVTAGFRGPATPLADGDIEAVAQTVLGCDPLHLRAVLAVETDGHGFDVYGRPKMLFEPHRFYAALVAHGTLAQVQLAEREGIAYRVWGAHPYPADSYPHLIAACAIDGQAALESASWGIGQVMGSNFTLAGCTSAADMVSAAMASGRQQIAMMARFIVRAGLQYPLQRGDWAGFARGYNGAGYARDHYDSRLEAYVRSHDRAPAVAAALPTPPSDPADALNGAELAAVAPHAT